MEQPTKEQVAKFEKEYNELCVKHGLILDFQPRWKQSQDTFMWSMVLVPMIAIFIPPKTEP